MGFSAGGPLAILYRTFVPPPPMRHIPNLICLVRIALIAPLIAAMLAGEQGRILVLFCIAAVSDGLDGYLAKRFGWTSDLGRLLDPMADKLLLMAVFITAAWLDIAPWWVAAVAVARDIVIGVGALIYRLWIGPLNGRPTVISKINTGMQMLYLLAVILASASGFPPREVLEALALFVVLTTFASGIDYVARFLERAFTRIAAT
jgi:cardiolipin synthase (CMP-forming)